jgi:hypothetical protein
MQLILTLIVIVYLVGIGVALSPTVQAKWNNGSASEFVADVAHELPSAAAWPARAYHSIADRG